MAAGVGAQQPGRCDQYDQHRAGHPAKPGGGGDRSGGEGHRGQNHEHGEPGGHPAHVAKAPGAQHVPRAASRS